ncbi:hypothetical protein [Pseudomonas mediterranea]|jgi:hypothetical protein|uniref:hypothetical protein n=1 Tax=Pseudomonas mediterranea TaxID=183795 RepID=UPI0006D8C92C|nr:hypothetical protein [Pseudomonas mediterranea]MDU9030890.1 hypothetical protein [Pseudomonas mediterranea]CAH0269247.1 hypothetical protein SRABI112_03592 [Pseudomonas mediterranea]
MDSKLSFSATLSLPDMNIHLLETLHGKPALATLTSFSGGFFSGRPQTVDHSNLLGMHAKAEGGVIQPLMLHFRHTAGGYTLSIKNTGEHHHKFIGKSWFDAIGVKDSGKPISFKLVDQKNRVITLENIKAKHSPLSLMTENKKYIGGLRMRGSPYRYLAETEEHSKLTFVLSII